ncbi:LysM peptidoglycan-binding domain-containing protein [Paenibacillus rhizophilus]|nr:LysM peptidoglycan-binding domain-containing protein [Paenibacillus rhizophilus]
MQNLFKIVIVLLLIISGFTVVGQVFASSVSSPQQEKRVVVEPGDTLWSIAVKNKPSDMRTVVYIEAIKRYNDLNGANIEAGVVLSVPVYK